MQALLLFTAFDPLCLLPTPPSPAPPRFCSTLFRSGIRTVGLFVSSCPKFAPTAPAGTYFLFVLLEKVCPGASIAAKGPRFQPVSFARAVRRACTFKAKL